MTVASIDIGSNTVLLLLADINTQILQIGTSTTIYRIPRISEGVRENHIISSYREELLFATLKEFQNIIWKNNCEIVLPVATNAFRIAKNAGQIINRIRTTFGWNTKIISGDEEARLTFIGVASSVIGGSKKVVIDIGGGSTEIISGKNNHIEYKNSFALGVVSLTERYFKNNPPGNQEIERAIKEVDVALRPVLNAFNTNNVIAVAGTPTTLACIKKGIRIFDDSLVDHEILTGHEIKSIQSWLITLTHAQIKEKFGEVVTGREDVLLAGTIILERIMHALNVNQITVSSKGLRFGVVYDYLNNINNFPGKK